MGRQPVGFGHDVSEGLPMTAPTPKPDPAPPFTIANPCCPTFAAAIAAGPVSWLPEPGDSVPCPWCEREIEGVVW